MKTEMPDHYGGKPIPDDAIEIALAAEKKKKEQEHTEGEPLDVKANITLSDYIQIPDQNILIAKQETLKGKTLENTHYKLAENGLFMPSPAIFMPYFVKVRDAAQGSLTLYDGNNNPISRDEAEDLWEYLSTNHRDGCWTWLDAFFPDIKERIIVYDHEVQRDSNKNKILVPQNIEELESTLDEDCYVSIDFDRQGLPKYQSAHQEYEQGENIYLWHPRNGTAVSFTANSGGGILNCNVSPGYSSPNLGVFACTEKPGEKQ